jgi:hypothetical protein
MTTDLKLMNVRLSFPALFEPEAFKPGDEPKYKATFLVAKDSPQAKAVDAAILFALKASYPAPGKAESIVKSIRNNPNKFCWQDGDTKAYDGYEGMMALSTKAKLGARPLVIDQNKSPLTAKDGKPYAGCYVNAMVSIFVYENLGVGVSASVRGVQFARDGDAFSAGRPADSSEFDDVTEGADAGEFA